MTSTTLEGKICIVSENNNSFMNLVPCVNNVATISIPETSNYL